MHRGLGTSLILDNFMVKRGLDSQNADWTRKTRFWRQNPYSMLLEAKKNGRKPKIPTPIRKPKDPGLPKLSSKTRTGHNVN